MLFTRAFRIANGWLCKCGRLNTTKAKRCICGKPK